MRTSRRRARRWSSAVVVVTRYSQARRWSPWRRRGVRPQGTQQRVLQDVLAVASPASLRACASSRRRGPRPATRTGAGGTVLTPVQRGRSADVSGPAKWRDASVRQGGLCDAGDRGARRAPAGPAGHRRAARRGAGHPAEVPPEHPARAAPRRAWSRATAAPTADTRSPGRPTDHGRRRDPRRRGPLGAVAGHAPEDTSTAGRPPGCATPGSRCGRASARCWRLSPPSPTSRTTLLPDSVAALIAADDAWIRR